MQFRKEIARRVMVLVLRLHLFVTLLPKEVKCPFVTMSDVAALL